MSSKPRIESRRLAASGLFAVAALAAPLLGGCSGDALAEVTATIESASKKVAESDPYMNDIDRAIEKLIAMGNWEMGESSHVRQEREKIRIEHDELMSRCLALKFEAGEKEAAAGVASLTDKAKDALARSERHYKKTRDFRNALESFRSWTERLAGNIAVCQTYTNQMRANLEGIAKTKEGASPALRDKITLFEARFEALKRGENEASGLARESLKQHFANPVVAEAGSKAALDKLVRLQGEIRAALVELEPLLLEAPPPPAKSEPPEEKEKAEEEKKPG